MFLKFLVILQAFVLLCTADEWPTEQVKQLYENGIAEFTRKMFDTLHHSVSKKDENVLFSPINVYAILGLTHFATNGDTASEVASILGLPNDNIDSYHYLTDVLLTLQNTTSTTETLINFGMFFEKQAEINETFANEIKKYYKSAIEKVDYSSQETTNYINNWVANRTNNRIPTLFTSPIPPETISLLISTLYFKADWLAKFKKTKTSKGKFNTGTEEIDVDFMQQTSSVPYTNNPTLQYEAIALDYNDREYSFFVVKPYTTDGIMSLTHQLKTDDLTNLIKSVHDNYTYVDYKIPRIKVHWKNDLKDTLAKLGVKQLFDKGDFSKLITSQNSVKVSSVTHATEIEVTEDGTIASATTAVQLVLTSLNPNENPPVPFYVDKPFMFFIYHHETKTFLFTGLIHHPWEE